MNWPDIVNGLWEATGALFILNHCRAVFRAGRVAGVSILSTVFFTGWGIWNLFYYPNLNQYASFVGGILIVVANILWIVLLAHYTRNPRVDKASAIR